MNITQLALEIEDLYIHQPKDFKKTLLMKETFGNPISYQYTEDNLNVFTNLIQYYQEKYSLGKAKDNTTEDIILELTRMGAVYELIFHNMQKINVFREKLDFMKYSLDTQLKLLFILGEDHQRIMAQINREHTTKNISAMQHLTAFKENEQFPNEQYSVVVKMEHLLDTINDVIPYLQYNDSNRTEKCFGKEPICHLNDPDFQEFITSSNLARTLKDIWELYKYENYDFGLIEGRDEFLFEPRNILPAKIHYIAGLRRESRQVEEVMFTSEQLTSFLSKSLRMQKRLAQRYQPEIWQSILMLEKTIYERCSQFPHAIIESVKSETANFILNRKIGNNKLQDILKMYEFLLTIAQIYLEILIAHRNPQKQDTFYMLCPEIDRQSMADSFANLYGYDNQTALTMLSYFIYKNERNTEADIFSAPLIPLQNGYLLFAPHLIMQLNIKRKIEHLMLDYKINRLETGCTYEENLRKNLCKIPYWRMYPNPIRLKLSGMDIDFDGIAIMQDYLIILEIKHLVTPYNSKRYHEDHKTIKKAASQLKKRIEVIQKDWEELRKKTENFLPSEPFPENRIIPIICTNIEDFTTLYYDKIIVTDEHVLLRFFQNGEIRTYTKEKIYNHKKIWNKLIPTIKDFIKYINEPPAVNWLFPAIRQNRIEIFKELESGKIIRLCSFDLDEKAYQKFYLGL